MILVFDLFVILLVCNQVAPYFAVGDTFGFSSMQEPSWLSSIDNNDIYDEDQFANDRLDDENPPTPARTTPRKIRRTTTMATTTSLPPFIPTTPPRRTTRRQLRPVPNYTEYSPDKLPAGRPLPDGTPRERPRVDEPDSDEDRSQLVHTILAFKNIVRSIETEMGEVKRTCEVCSISSSNEDRESSNTNSETLCEESKIADAKIKQQLRDVKGSIKNIEDTLRHLSHSVTSLGVHMSGIQPRDCMDLFTRGQGSSGVFYIQPHNVDRPFLAYCDVTDGGGWTIIQRRTDVNTDFDRGMGSYRRGFGDPNLSHWLGLDKIHPLLKQDEYQLRIDLQLYNGRRAYAYYRYFMVGDYNSDYVLSVGNYNGTAGDAMTFHNGMPFTTKDRDHDRAQGHNCADIYKGGWWYGDCLYANLNGLNIGQEETESSAQGIIWYDLTGFHSSLQYASMAVRPTS